MPMRMKRAPTTGRRRCLIETVRSPRVQTTTAYCTGCATGTSLFVLFFRARSFTYAAVASGDSSDVIIVEPPARREAMIFTTQPSVSVTSPSRMPGKPAERIASRLIPTPRPNAKKRDQQMAARFQELAHVAIEVAEKSM